jgi:uncharacterized protein YbcV (DUF1398 family)
MFTAEQIKEKLLKVKSGADFPALAMDLKNMGVTYYETRIEDGSSIYHGGNGFELHTGPNYGAIEVAGKTDLKQLKQDITNHQRGKSDYLQISRECAANGIEKWAVCLVSMTCTYIDKAGQKAWVEHIPDASVEKSLFTGDQLKAAHAKVRSGADFPVYIREIKALGVTRYETYVADGHADYHGTGGHTAKLPAKYAPLVIAGLPDKKRFQAELKAHQNGKTDFLTFIRMSAEYGIEKWQICMEQMTCTYYDRSGNSVLVEEIPQ